MSADGQTLDFREEDHTSIQLNILTSKNNSIFSLIFTETPCIPPFIIVHTYKNASRASGRRCASDETPVKGMTPLA